MDFDFIDVSFFLKSDVVITGFRNNLLRLDLAFWDRYQVSWLQCLSYQICIPVMNCLRIDSRHQIEPLHVEITSKISWVVLRTFISFLRVSIFIEQLRLIRWLASARLLFLVLLLLFSISILMITDFVLNLWSYQLDLLVSLIDVIVRRVLCNPLVKVVIAADYFLLFLIANGYLHGLFLNNLFLVAAPRCFIGKPLLLRLVVVTFLMLLLMLLFSHYLIDFYIYLFI